MAAIGSASSAPVRPAVAREDPAFPWSIGASLLLAVAGGFVLALLLPLAVVFSWDWGVRWRALVQVHGHIQVSGWLGLFIIGMAFRLVPRFAGRPLRFPRLTTATVALLLAGLLGRALAQPALETPGMPSLLTAAALAELAAAVCFALVIVATLAPALLTLPPAPLLTLGAAGFVAQAALSALWLASIDGQSPALPAARDNALLSVQFYAFLLPCVLAVSLRALPSFFAHPPPSVRRTWAIALALAVGSVLGTAAPLLWSGAVGARAAAGGGLLLAAGIAAGAASTGVWRSPERLRASARPAALLIRTAYAWLFAGALALAWLSVDGLLRATLPAQRYEDALRHALALGVFTTLLVGMAHLVLPWLAMRRQRPKSLQAEVWLLWALLTGATALRVAGALWNGGGRERYHVIAAGGVLAILAIGVFAERVRRASRRRPEIPVIELTERPRHVLGPPPAPPAGA